jgi:spermidine synthase
MKPISRQNLHTLIGLLFVISGGIGLIYQIVWFKYLSLFLGNTTYAQTIVLATFMGGLAIGSAWWGKKADSSAHQLRLYAILELGIGVYCFFYPTFLELLKNTFISIVVSSNLPSDGTAVHLLKLLMSLCSLLLPTVLMGGTLPILVRFISHKLEESGKNIATLYFLNSFGAVLGSLLAGFFLIRILGLRATVYSAASFNLIIGGFAFFLSTRKIFAEPVEVIEKSRESERLFSRREVILAVGVAGISGLAAMIYEVTWVRLLMPVLGSSTYSFSLMLVAFISGITLGSLIVSAIVQRVKNLVSLLAWCQVGIVVSMLITLPLYGRVPYEFWKAAFMLTRSDATYPIFLSIQFIFGFLLMIIPTIFLGMSLPVATRIAARGLDVLGKSVGNIFAVNTLGTVIGSLLAGLILIPLIGVKHTIEIGIACNLLAAVSIFFLSSSFLRRQILIAIPLMLLMLIAYELFIPNWNRNVMLEGVFRRINLNDSPPASYEDFVRNTESLKVLYYREGTMATIGVIEAPFEDETHKILVINGKGDASSKGDLPTQLLCGQLPCLFHSNPQNVLVVGLGSGVTVGSVLTHPVKHVDCVEIAPEVVEASSYFDDVNRKPFNDPRAHLYIEDALAYMKLTPQMYDVIINEPTNPWIAGVGNLFTTEYFVNSKRKMNPGGIMVQWFHLYEMNDDLFKMVVRTFQANFTYVSMFQPLGVDVIMLGSDQPIAMEYEKLQERMARQAIKEDLMRISLPDAASLLSLEMLSSNSVMQYVGEGDLNTEDLPRLEYGAPGAFFVNAGVKQLGRFDERMHCDSVSLQIKKILDNHRLTTGELRNIGFYHTSRGKGTPWFGFPILQNVQKKSPKDAVLLERLIATAQRLNLDQEPLFYSKQLMDLEPNNPNAVAQYAWLKFLADRRFATVLTSIEIKESETLFKKCITLSSDTVDRFRLGLADMYFGMQQYDKAVDQYARAIQIRAKYIGDRSVQDDILFLKLAKCLNRLGKNDKAFSYALQAVNINPRNEEARDLIYEMWTKAMHSKKKKK